MNTQPQPIPDPSDAASPTPHLEVLSTPPPPARKTRRNGKIARLPKPVRDMVCLMIRDGVPYDRIVGALDEHGIIVTPRNISNFKTRGGYAEWNEEEKQILEGRLQQDALTDHLREEGNELPEVGLQTAAACYSKLLLRPEMQQKLEANPEAGSAIVGTLCRLSTEILKLQKYRDDCHRVGHPNWKREGEKAEEREELEVTRRVYGAPSPDPNAAPCPKQARSLSAPEESR